MPVSTGCGFADSTTVCIFSCTGSAQMREGKLIDWCRAQLPTLNQETVQVAHLCSAVQAGSHSGYE